MNSGLLSQDVVGVITKSNEETTLENILYQLLNEAAHENETKTLLCLVVTVGDGSQTI